MKMKRSYLFTLLLSAFLLISCADQTIKSDAYGNFEADEITVSSQSNGLLVYFDAQEGQTLDSGRVVAAVDTVQLVLKISQLKIQKDIIRSKRQTIAAQADVIIEQKAKAEADFLIYSNLLEGSAATKKQVDDIKAQVSVFEKQIASTKTQGTSIGDELKSIDIQIDQINDQIRKCYVVNPIGGTVLTKYANAGEITAFGKPLYKIAGLSDIFLKVYVSGDQISSLKLNGKAEVLTDTKSGEMQKHEGTVTWISDKAEFTPKIIQTKAERVNLVYAVKIKVINDGSLKIGMPGEANFNVVR
jgi:HlyD family secretion protein